MTRLLGCPQVLGSNSATSHTLTLKYIHTFLNAKNTRFTWQKLGFLCGFSFSNCIRFSTLEKNNFSSNNSRMMRKKLKKICKSIGKKIINVKNWTLTRLFVVNFIYYRSFSKAKFHEVFSICFCCSISFCDLPAEGMLRNTTSFEFLYVETQFSAKIQGSVFLIYDSIESFQLKATIFLEKTFFLAPESWKSEKFNECYKYVLLSIFRLILPRNYCLEFFHPKSQSKAFHWRWFLKQSIESW